MSIVFLSTTLLLFFSVSAVSLFYLRRFYTLYKKSEFQETALLGLLAKEQRHRKNMLSKFSHEVRNPLSKIMGHAELLLFDLEKGNPIEAEDLKTIYHGSKELAEILKGIGNYTIMETSFVSPAVEESVDLNFVLKAALDSLSDIVKYKKIQLRYNPDHSLLCKYDGNFIFKVFSSALLSMVKLANKQELTILLKREGAHFFLEASLENIQLSSEEIGNLFHPFEAPNTVVTNFDMGIGVYYCKRLLEQMRGTIHLRSIGATKQTILEVALPAF